jgi:xylulose-5-phosphate/fructose-6-phosphate phosphoketolase
MIGIWQWASNDHESEPYVVIACAGDVPTLVFPFCANICSI